MSIWRHHEIWLAIGLAICIASGVHLVQVKAREGEALEVEEAGRIEEARRRAALPKKAKKAKQPKLRGPVEDDVSLDDLAILVRHPNYEIRRAAVKIMLHRFRADEFCMDEFRKDYESNEQPSSENQFMARSDVASTLIELAKDYDVRLHPTEAGQTGWRGDCDDNQSFTSDGNDVYDGDAVFSRIFSEGTREGLGRRLLDAIEDEVRDELERATAASATTETEQSPEEIALEHRRRREAVVIGTEERDGRVEVIMPHDPRRN